MSSQLKSLPLWRIVLEPCPRVPPELWLEVMDLLDCQALARLGQTCKALRRLSTPLLHKELHVTTPRKGPWKAPTGAAALCVRNLVAIYGGGSVYVLLGDSFWAAVPRFSNLQSLTLRKVHFQSTQWKRFQKMLAPPMEDFPHLTSLRLIHCTPSTPNPSTPGFALSHIYIEDSDKQSRSWGNLASPAHTTHLTVTVLGPEEALAIPCLPRLRFLRILRKNLREMSCLPFLANDKCPNLETLEMEPTTSSWFFPAVEFYLPKLRSYCGPGTHAPVFARLASLEQATLYLPAEEDTTHSILSQLSHFSPELKTLRLCSRLITAYTLDTIKRFRTLQELVLDLRGVAFDTLTRQVQSIR
jgi:hypothetical protein